VATIVTNEYLAALVRAHGGHATIVADLPIEYEGGTPRSDPQQFTVVFVTSFDRDEPIPVMIETARRLPDVRFFMTGDPPARADLVREALPSNLELTGFLASTAYGTLLRNADVVVALTTDEHTMQRAAYEAIYQGTPVIVSNSELLRTAFDDGALHVENSPDAVVRAVLQVRAKSAEYRNGAERLRSRKRAQWQRTKAALRDTVASS
jgi:glycosyltransferase involved in cell wall biosynthesis